MKLFLKMQNRGVLLYWSAFCACLFLFSISRTQWREPAKPLHTFDTEEKDLDLVKDPIEMIMTGDPIELAQDDPRIKKYIWDHELIEQPSSKGYNLDKPDKNPSMGQGQMIHKLFNHMRGGFFVESGALDGETRSNTLYLEKELGWTGLLIEADPKNYAIVLKKQRKAYTSNTCMATKPFPHKVVFQQYFNVGKIKEEFSKGKGVGAGFAVVQCFPLFTLLNALSISTVDYFSLDVEGVEMEVLENIPFDKIFIKTLSVEFNHIPKGKKGLKKFMEGKGYVVVAEVTHPQGLANDFIFVHSSLPDLIARGKEEA